MNQDRAGDGERAIAVVGASCRLPGGITGLDELWDALRAGRDLVRAVPDDRFDTDRFVDTEMPRAGKSYTGAGGFLDDIAGFDAGYFGISPKEAAHMDPQHRLLLELTAEALDDAAIAPAALAGSDTAVYVGISDASYGALQMLDPRTISPYTMSGAASSIAANRVSHAFDLHGPSMAVDTACSSSLVALDRACHTLWEGTSRTVLCGGANVLLSPYHYVGFSQASMLSQRGRCASFSADADGFVRAEGGGMVLLKRLADALADGDRVLGVILGSASNSDGRTLGLSLPNPEAQEALLRQVYAASGVHPDELVYFEAHGTGTPVGDPLEAQAIGRALGVRRITGPLPIGSVKTNVGHLEPASGMAGLCKALLVLRHRTIPASLHARRPHPDIDFTGLGLDLTAAPRDLAPGPAPGDPAAPGRRPVVGVNSFGFGGANAHTILTAAPPPPEREECPPPPEGLPVLVSARTPQALAQAASRMAGRLADAAPGEFYDLAYTSCLRRGRHEHRTAVLARTAPEAADRLAAFAEHGTGPAVEGVSTGRVAFVFSGNGSQWAGMGADLYAGHPVFREAVAAVDAELAPLLGWSVAEELALPPRRWRLAATEVAQPLLFAVQCGVVAVLRAQGVEPAMVLGHSVGEVAAAHACGALTLAQAARVIAARSTVQAATAGTGRMAALGLGPEQAAGELAPYAGRLEIAGVNSGRDVTVAGDADALAALGERLGGRGVFFRDLGLDYAFHSRAMDGQREPLAAALGGLAGGPAAVPLYSTVTGVRTVGADLGAEYWWRNVREPVRFADAVERAMGDGADVFLEIGPHPVLRTYLGRIVAQRPGQQVAVLATLSRDADGPQALSTARASLLAAGARTDWDRYFPRPGRVAALPAYPWQHERHWSGGKELWNGSGPLEHPLLGARVPAPTPLWAGPVEPALLPWLADHRVAGSVVLPATGYVEMALAAGRATTGGPAEVEHLDVQTALVVPWADASSVRVQVALNPDDGVLLVSSTDDHAAEPRPHARARVRALVEPRPAPLGPGELDAARERCPRRVSAEEHYAGCDAAGLGYGPAFRVLTGLRVGDGEVVAEYAHETPGAPYTVHPALLDGALQAGAPLLADSLADGHAYLPAAIGAVRVWGTPAPSGTVRVRERSRTGQEVCWDITVADPDGTVTVRIDGCRLRRFATLRRTPVDTLHTELRAAPHADEPCAPSPLPPPRAVMAACEERVTALRAAWRDLRYGQAIPVYVEAFTHEVGEVIEELLPGPATPFALPDLVELGLDPRHLRLVELMLPTLREHGVLTTGADGRHRRTGRPLDAAGLLRKALETGPAYVNDLAVAVLRGAHTSEALRSGEDALEDLFADGPVRTLEHFYDIAPFCRFHNRLAQALLREIVRGWPAGRPLRILEIGAGTGGTTAALLPLLPRDRTRYCFTDASAFFFPRAQSRFSDHDFVEYRTFDLDRDPAGQGFAPGTFDLVVAGNALHTAGDLAAALRRVAALLAPGGHLLAIEVHAPELLAPLFGTLDSFYPRQDPALRPHSLLLPREEWPGLLERCGYAEIARTGDDRPPAGEHGSVLLASVPAAPDVPAPAARAALPAPDPAVPAGPAAPDAPRTGTSFLIAVESPQARDLGRALADAVRADGAAVTGPVPADRPLQDWRASLAEASDAAGGGPVAVVLLLGEAAEDAPADVVRRATRRAETLRVCATACDEVTGSNHPELWLVTGPSGAVPTGTGEPARPADAAAWGFARGLANELPDLTCRRLSLQRTADPAGDARRLVRELFAPTEEDEIVLTAEGRFLPRERHRPTVRPAGDDVPFTLRVRDPGLSYRLVWEETERPAPGPGEVLVRVRATALNYRDVMQSVGLLPAEAIEGTASAAGCGLECAGVVAACGPGVTGFAPGDRVAGFAPVALSSHVVTPAWSLWPLPDDITDAEAATMPVAFGTVHYSLGTLARLRKGETLLVHGAAGGVGLAAVQYAAACGAHVIATAGSELKREFLRGLGVPHVLDSRSLDFAARVREITKGQGVDVVLNSLSGEAMARSLELVRPGGRFLELGKRDFYENKPLLLRPFAGNIAFFGVDLTKVLADRRQTGALLADVRQAAVRDAVRPLPHSVFPAARVAEAFELMQHSHHTGKVVVAFDPLDEPPLVEPLRRRPCLDPAGTYLVTGGTGGFGAATAGWLAGLGARHLALVSRRGAEAPEAGAVLEGLRARGVRATAHAADAADPEAMAAVVAEIDSSGHPLRGVVHAAMHLDDELLLDLDAERMAAVLAPKIGGAVVLDALTRERDVDLFLVYSSGTTLTGNVKQAPYLAGNLFLEALVRERRAAGRPGLAVAWGALSETGYVARNDLGAAMASFGLEPVAPKEAFAAAEALLGTGADVAAVLRFVWARTRRLLPLVDSPRLAGLVPAGAGEDDLSREELLSTLGRMSDDEALAYLTDNVTGVLAGVLHMEPGQIDPHRRVDSYGLDSLMAAELLVSLQQRYGIEIPPMELLRNTGGTLDDIARTVYLRLGLARPAQTPALPAPRAGEPTAPEEAAAPGSAAALPHQLSAADSEEAGSRAAGATP
ncbi:SDR family NAD(P)-dependent oxidoreductase [Streptomyces sp. TRM 70351]|uniref:SDR family NAD(P)-dependent oxidoreductase n=1 Tax=Streptomyces sp. TRM 70351 TaxID=3116552 RepID=UPI002E7B705C|nr:SDR family NAD(P)-dependent oxidoreductase [Streptomyces sp. TRM 70351]MEE1929655.1 SDR family NAD(P)-dependent oxidoreductase [Streptomyces sp. TRM 70351]